MLRKDEGVILTTTRRGESSKLVTFLGRESGKTRLHAKGALGPKSPFRGCLEPGTFVEVIYYFKEGRSVFFLKEVAIVSAVEADGLDLTRMAATLAALEILDQVCYWGHPEHETLDLVQEFLAAEAVDDPLLFLLALEFKLLELLGVLPDFVTCAECGESSAGGYYHPEDGASTCERHARSSPHRIRIDENVTRVCVRWAAEPLSSLRADRCESEVRKRLGKILHWTYTFHINGYSLPQALKLIPRGN
jgi:DNA repair protein RecO (recombination protein O)